MSELIEPELPHPSDAIDPAPEPEPAPVVALPAWRKPPGPVVKKPDPTDELDARIVSQGTTAVLKEAMHRVEQGDAPGYLRLMKTFIETDEKHGGLTPVKGLEVHVPVMEAAITIPLENGDVLVFKRGRTVGTISFEHTAVTPVLDAETKEPKVQRTVTTFEVLSSQVQGAIDALGVIEQASLPILPPPRGIVGMPPRRAF